MHTILARKVVEASGLCLPHALSSLDFVGFVEMIECIVEDGVAFQCIGEKLDERRFPYAFLADEK